MLDSPFFCEEVLSPPAQKMQPDSRKPRKPLTLIHITNAMVYSASETQENLDISRFKRTRQPAHIPDIGRSDFCSVG
jgi:hypothetical protein